MSTLDTPERLREEGYKALTGAGSSDFNVFVFLTVLILVMALAGLIKEKVEWAILPGFAVILGIFFHLALLADGSLTQVSGGVVTAIASASTDVVAVWQGIQYVPLTLTIMALLIAAYRVEKVF